MRTLHAYLTRQVLLTTMMTVAVFTFVLLIGNVLKEVFLLLQNQQATLATVAYAIGLLIPYVLVYSLPMGMLTAMLLTFGRLSAERELTAIRGSGISVVALITPLLLLAVAFSAVCAYINLDLAPRCRYLYKNLVYDMAALRPSSVLTAGCFNSDIERFIVYVGKIQNKEYLDLLISQVDANGDVIANLRASKGMLIAQPGTNQFVLRLFEVSGAQHEQGTWHPIPYAGEIEYKVSLQSRSSRSLKINEMTFLQLREQLDQLRAARVAGPSGAHADSPLEDLRRMADASISFADLTMPLKVEMHWQLAFSFACIGFTLVGIPLGIRSHRKETSIGIAMALLLVMVYYSFFILAQTLRTKAQWHPHLFCWIPNILFQIVGAVLLWRVNKR